MMRAASNSTLQSLHRYLLTLAVVGCLMLSAIGFRESVAQPDIDPNVAFVEFWSDYESIFLFHPHLVNQIFRGIVELKGNQRTASKYIRSEILSCASGSTALSECRMDQLNLERKKRRMSRYTIIPVNITSISSHRFKKDRSRLVLTVRWQPVMVKPPVMPVDDFYRYLGVADESKYYRGKKGLENIQINPLFEESVTVVTTRARAENILTLYNNPPADLKDSFVFRVDTVNMEQNGRTVNVDLNLKAVKVKINHLMFKTTKELLQ